MIKEPITWHLVQDRMRASIPTGEARELDDDEAEHVLYDTFGIGLPYRERAREHAERLRMLREMNQEIRALEELPRWQRPTMPAQFDPVANSRPMPASVPDLEIEPVETAAWVLP